MEEDQEELRPETLEEVHLRLQRYQNLVKSQGWEELVRIGEAQLANRRRMLDGMQVRTQEEVADYNWARGEIKGIELFLAFPQLLIEDAHEAISLLEEGDI